MIRKQFFVLACVFSVAASNASDPALAQGHSTPMQVLGCAATLGAGLPAFQNLLGTPYGLRNATRDQKLRWVGTMMVQGALLSTALAGLAVTAYPGGMDEIPVDIAFFMVTISACAGGYGALAYGYSKIEIGDPISKAKKRRGDMTLL